MSGEWSEAEFRKYMDKIEQWSHKYDHQALVAQVGVLRREVEEQRKLIDDLQEQLRLFRITYHQHLRAHHFESFVQNAPVVIFPPENRAAAVAKKLRETTLNDSITRTWEIEGS